jgi:hypothetical protein
VLRDGKYSIYIFTVLICNKGLTCDVNKVQELMNIVAKCSIKCCNNRSLS